MADVSWAPIACRHCTQPLPDISFNPHTLSIPMLQKKEWKLTEFKSVAQDDLTKNRWNCWGENLFLFVIKYPTGVQGNKAVIVSRMHEGEGKMGPVLSPDIFFQGQ